MYDVSTENRPASGRSRTDKADALKAKAERKLTAKARAEQRKVEKATEKAERLREAAARDAEAATRAAERARKRAAQAARHDRAAEVAAAKQAQLDAWATAFSPVDIWTRAEPGDRKPRFTRDQIAAAAVRIADEEGFAALSMRRLAAELGAGTMTLYHYVRTKDELMALVNDLVLGEVAMPEGQRLPSTWREAVMVNAQRTRDALLRHPWVLELSDEPPVGPNGVRHFDQTMESLQSLDVDLTERVEIAMLVDEYVFGYCVQRRQSRDNHPTDLNDRVLSFVHSLVQSGRYPTLSALTDRLGFMQAWHSIQTSIDDEARFERNLLRILDGIEAGLHRRR